MFRLSSEQFLGLEANMPCVEADRLLRAARRGEVRLSPQGWYQTTLLATGDEEQALEAFNRAALEEQNGAQPDK